MGCRAEPGMDGGHCERELTDWPPVISPQDGYSGNSVGSVDDSSSSQTETAAKRKGKQLAKQAKNRNRREKRRARNREPALDTPYPQRIPSGSLHSLRRNLRARKDGVVHHYPGFDLEDTIRNTRKTQPAGNKDPDFERANESKLKLVEGDMVTLADKYVPMINLQLFAPSLTCTFPRNGIPCVIKFRGAKMASWNAGLVQAIEEYANTRKVSDDPVRHGQMGLQASCLDSGSNPGSNGSAKANQAGQHDARVGTARGSILIHRWFAARMENKTHDIELHPGPAETYGSRKAIEALKKFAAKIAPLTQFVEAIYSALLPDEFAKYKEVFKFLRGSAQDSVDDAFGIWTSRSLVFDALSNIHRDLEDVCRGWCALFPCGDFQGGDACFPSLGAKVELPVGEYYVHTNRQPSS